MIKAYLHKALFVLAGTVVLFAICDLLGDTGVKIKAFIFNPVKSLQAMAGSGGNSSGS